MKSHVSRVLSCSTPRHQAMYQDQRLLMSWLVHTIVNRRSVRYGIFSPALASLSPRAPCRPTKPSYLDTHSTVSPLETKAIRLYLCRQLSTLGCIRPRSYHDVLQPQKPHTPSPFFAQSPLSTTTKLQEVKRRGAIYPVLHARRA